MNPSGDNTITELCARVSELGALVSELPALTQKGKEKSFTNYVGYGKIGNLDEILAQIAQFNVSDYDPDQVPEGVVWNVSYICACFLAQHTKDGIMGVDTESAEHWLRIGESIPYAERLNLARIAIAELGGLK